MSKMKMTMPVSVSFKNDSSNIVLPICLMFLGLTVSITLILLVLA